MTLLKATTADEGMYSLIVTTQTRNVIASLSVNISIGKLQCYCNWCVSCYDCLYVHTVKFTTEINASVIPEIGQQCNLTCTITNLEAEHLNPIITYQWYKDGAILPNTNDSIIALQSLTHTDVGEYTCKTIVSSEHLIPLSTSKESIFRLCFTLGMFVYDLLFYNV